MMAGNAAGGVVGVLQVEMHHAAAGDYLPPFWGLIWYIPPFLAAES
jgi:hypothetical protein